MWHTKLWSFSLILIPSISYCYANSVRLRRNEPHNLEVDPCTDQQTINDLQSIVYPSQYSKIDLPWLRKDLSTKIYQSDGFLYQWSWLKSLPVRGMNNITVDDVIRWMDSHRCFYMPWGSAVRDSVMRRKPTRIEGEVTCHLETLFEQCKKSFGILNCTVETMENGYAMLLIGDPHTQRYFFSTKVLAHPVTVYDWNTTFNIDPSDWDYTINTMAVFDNLAGEVFLMDPLGRGFTDICDRIIHSTSDDWETWADKGREKVARYFHLRSLGFRDSNSNFRDFIIETMEKKMKKMHLQKVFCEDILGGGFTWFGDGATSTCHAVEPNGPRAQRIHQARQNMQEELGPIYDSVVIPEIDGMEVIFVSEHAVDLVKHGPRSDQRVSVAIRRINSQTFNRTVTTVGKVINIKPIRHKNDLVPTSEEGDDRMVPIGGVQFHSDELAEMEDNEEDDSYEEEENSVRGAYTSPSKSSPKSFQPTYFCLSSFVVLLPMMLQQYV